jgi:tetratricopeptide (TPR) repeat protein
VQRARELLRTKRAIKGQMWGERHQGGLDNMPEPPTAESIPIITRSPGPFMHYPESAHGLRVVMRLLPPATLASVRRIVLEPGGEYPREAEDSEGYDPDPLTGRPGIELLPGVYVAPVLGTYNFGSATVSLHGYVYDRAAVPDRELRELYLRLHLLSTLLHELAHHVDHATRVARGRWLCIPGDKAEEFAERKEQEWTREYAVPYLQGEYPDAVRALEEWVAHHGGARIPLSLWAEHSADLYFSIGAAFQDLVVAVDAGKSLRETRLRFANDLHCAEHYDAALESVDTVLMADPHDVEALTTKGLIFERLDRLEEAERVADAALARSPDCVDAWQVLLHVYRRMGRWDRLEAAASRVIDLSLEPWRRDGARADRATARIEMRDFLGTASDIEELSRSTSRLRRRRAELLRAIWLLRQGRHEDALTAAAGLMNRAKRLFEPELLAVIADASAALGRLSRSQRLDDDALARLRRRGYAAWADRIAGLQQAEFGAGRDGRH